ncbi:hypothetical protein FNV43_RR10938 [Rhamnella rubrinervis]|uniref:Uncharacterized protein n=1 Tax=Rhamnella rubrinervis TaxID=2594499 RepID=A0A8K0MH64_9ROSA|nr:hypothetical protein FNV43_RR10938 [Rhamnella rubrinervis]
MAVSTISDLQLMDYHYCECFSTMWFVLESRAIWCVPKAPSYSCGLVSTADWVVEGQRWLVVVRCPKGSMVIRQLGGFTKGYGGLPDLSDLQLMDYHYCECFLYYVVCLESRAIWCVPKAPQIIHVVWSPLPIGWLKVNTDGAADGCSCPSGCDGYFVTSRGFTKGRFVVPLDSCYTFENEL